MQKPDETMQVDTLRVLVADDEPGMRTGAMRALKDVTFELPDIQARCRFVVEEAETGDKALELICNQPPDILLLDHKMPGVSGLDILKHLSDASSEVLTIMITAYASLEVAISATRQGAYDFLAKPFTPEELRSSVRKAARQVILQRHARALAREKREIRFQFISVLAHELKAPLAAVEGYLHILKDRSLGDKPEAYNGMLDRSLVRTENMRKLIHDLLDLTRIESGLQQRTLSRVDVAQLARHAMDTVTHLAGERNITVSLAAPETLAMTADPREVEMILNNLLSNAVKYNRPGGKVDMAIAHNDGHVSISVTDTGIGIAPQNVDRLFQEFYRVHSDKTRAILGSGLGLSITKKLAQLYDGDITVKSTPDVGSTFTVTLSENVEAKKPENA